MNQERWLKNGISRIWGAGAGLARALGGAVRAAGGGAASLVGRNSGEALAANETLSPVNAKVPEGRRVYAVGDIHGRADLLEQLIDDLLADIAAGGFRAPPILVFLGDYVDRGVRSRDVIDLLLSERLSPFETYFLKGNHEAAMLQFLSDPGIGPRWAEYGGVETLVSYGVRPPRTRTSKEEWEQASQDLRIALPANHVAFLNNLDLSVRIGDYVFVHAGVRPGVPLDQQAEHDLLWIRDDFLHDSRWTGALIVHGHTPEHAPYRDSRRIGIDTGAYISGRLTAARFEHDRVEFISTSPGRGGASAGAKQAG